ncbi:MAG TPA: MBL fold metallo-hydrolase, partial [Desulfobacteraceae bacterium]|nr:MBL fold metallo-hydrolase [Desulfobacteraceae bacterium]
THLHFDHCGNTPKCENAEVIVQAAELEFARRPHPLFYGSYPTSILPRIRFREVSGDVEVASGIRVVQVPGHTPGAQAVSIETRKGQVYSQWILFYYGQFLSPGKNEKRVARIDTRGPR